MKPMTLAQSVRRLSALRAVVVFSKWSRIRLIQRLSSSGRSVWGACAMESRGRRIAKWVSWSRASTCATVSRTVSWKKRINRKTVATLITFMRTRQTLRCKKHSVTLQQQGGRCPFGRRSATETQWIGYKWRTRMSMGPAPEPPATVPVGSISRASEIRLIKGYRMSNLRWNKNLAKINRLSYDSN